MSSQTERLRPRQHVCLERQYVCLERTLVTFVRGVHNAIAKVESVQLSGGKCAVTVHVQAGDKKVKASIKPLRGALKSVTWIRVITEQGDSEAKMQVIRSKNCPDPNQDSVVIALIKLEGENEKRILALEDQNKWCNIC